MTVWRRYSDFEWLHKRLSTVYPAAIIPLFPEKRCVSRVAVRWNAREQRSVVCSSMSCRRYAFHGSRSYARIVNQHFISARVCT